MKTFKKVREALDSIDNINYGGCGISALSMYRWLKDNNKLSGDESFTFLYAGWDYTFTENEAILNTNSNNCGNKLKAASHIMLFHKGKLYDSEGKTVQSKYINKHEKISVETLLETINYSHWNSSFDREESIPLIEEQLGIDLSDIELTVV